MHSSSYFKIRLGQTINARSRGQEWVMGIREGESVWKTVERVLSNEEGELLKTVSTKTCLGTFITDVKISWKTQNKSGSSKIYNMDKNMMSYETSCIATVLCLVGYSLFMKHSWHVNILLHFLSYVYVCYNHTFENGLLDDTSKFIG